MAYAMAHAVPEPQCIDDYSTDKGFNHDPPTPLQQLVGMGFDPNECGKALEMGGGDFQTAFEILTVPVEDVGPQLRNCDDATMLNKYFGEARSAFDSTVGCIAANFTDDDLDIQFRAKLASVLLGRSVRKKLPNIHRALTICSTGVTFVSASSIRAEDLAILVTTFRRSCARYVSTHNDRIVKNAASTEAELAKLKKQVASVEAKVAEAVAHGIADALRTTEAKVVETVANALRIAEAKAAERTKAELEKQEKAKVVQEKAATVLQATQRGRRVRRVAAEMRASNHAEEQATRVATVLQKHWRGHLGVRAMMAEREKQEKAKVVQEEGEELAEEAEAHGDRPAYLPDPQSDEYPHHRYGYDAWTSPPPTCVFADSPDPQPMMPHHLLRQPMMPHHLLPQQPAFGTGVRVVEEQQRQPWQQMMPHHLLPQQPAFGTGVRAVEEQMMSQQPACVFVD